MRTTEALAYKNKQQRNNQEAMASVRDNNPNRKENFASFSGQK